MAFLSGCGCCGRSLPSVESLLRVSNGSWRCPDHMGRTPCLIDGCGRTFKNDGDYSYRIMCGTHWRMAPKRWRQHVSKLRRMAEKQGWPDRLYTLFLKAWERCERAAVKHAAGDLDQAEINRLFGWDAPCP